MAGVGINGVYISKEGLPGDLLGNLENVAVNAGSAFLAGEAANLMKKPANIASNAMVMYNSVVDPSVINKITVDLAQHSATVVVNELSSYLTDKTTELLSIDKMLGVLTESTAYWLKEYTISPAEFVSMVRTVKVEDTNKKAEENSKNEKINMVKEKMSEYYGKCKDFYDKNVGALDDGISTITAYVSLGPDWIVTQTNSYVSQLINKVEGYIDSTTKMAIKFRDNTIDTVGQTLGKTAAATVNAIALRTAKKLKTEAEQLISDTLLKVQNVLASALMIVRQLTGIAVPIPFPPLDKLTKLF